jgi:hypothetical protein
MAIDDSIKANNISKEELKRLSEIAERAKASAAYSSEALQAPRESLREFLAKQDYSNLRQLLAPHVEKLKAIAERACAAANADYA